MLVSDLKLFGQQMAPAAHQQKHIVRFLMIGSIYRQKNRRLRRHTPRRSQKLRNEGLDPNIKQKRKSGSYNQQNEGTSPKIKQ